MGRMPLGNPAAYGILFLLLAWLMPVQGQTPLDSLKQHFSFRLPPPEVLYVLGAEWRDSQGLPVSLPDVRGWDEEVTYEHTFDLGCDPEDSVFLVLEGFVWAGEAELNGAFLETNPYPLQTWAIAIGPDMVRPGWNRLRLTGYRGSLIDYAPEKFVGFLGPAYIMSREQWDRYRRGMPQDTAPEGAILGAIGPFPERKAGEVLEAFSLALALEAASRAGIRYIWLPALASRDQVVFCRDAGFEVVAAIPENTEIIWLNTFAFEPVTFPRRPQFWLEENGRRSPYYGLGVMKKHPPGDSGNIPGGLVLISLLPLLVAALIRVLSPLAFRAMFLAWRAPARGMDTWYNLLMSNGALTFAFTLLRIIQMAGILTLWIWILRSQGLWSWLNLFKSWSILSQLFYATQSPLALFGRALLVAGAGVGLMFLVNNLLGLVYKKADFPGAVLASEALAAFPLWWILGASLVISLLAGKAFLILAIVLVVSFFAWRFLIFFLNGEKHLGITAGVKYLYICASIFPYLLLF